ncbi:MAG: endolytic transglycosylase MltG [Candidatus Eisenbacteria bacterium]|uniref:Endolytic murein transglycosylase n=1 Tax=Eiseniibacteriota bacterium TaxID=2212470 RepID=A0A849SHL7_UNCEI|nr:endolytic transglycosylase MltG [Candidatus Eisenbacteria bacterium]
MTRPKAFGPGRWALLLLLGAAVLVAADLFLPAGVSPLDERRVVIVQRGQSLRSVGDELKRVGLLRSTVGFHGLARLMGLDRRIKAGQYSFRLGTTVPEILRLFARGMSGLSLVTIPEGLTLTEVSLLLSNHLGVPISSFDSLAHRREFLDSLGITAPSLEGYLAPDTYEFLPDTPPEAAFRTMVTRTQRVLRDAAAGRDSLPHNLTLYQVLILASIVEAEAQREFERPRIARVYLNRLEAGMRLQADPTVGYAIGRGPRTRLYFRDLGYASPYNTYTHAGLPPGPICNPRRSSILAVLDASPGIRDFYFVAKGDGTHWFSPTYEGHLENIRRARAPAGPPMDSLPKRDSTDRSPVTPPAAG